MAPQKLTAEEVKALYERHGPALAAYACCCGLDFASAQDVVQQFFLKLLRGNGPAPEMPLAYAYRAVKNASLNLQRDRRRESELPKSEPWFVLEGMERNDVAGTLGSHGNSAQHCGLALPLCPGKVARSCLEPERLGLSELVRSPIPSPEKVNDARSEVYTARQSLLGALNGK
ncbi:MAG TPA: sigma factor [Candidatus Acidoferrum sp.]